MRTITIPLILLSAIAIGALASVHAHASVVAPSTADSSTGPFNPNSPAPDAFPRRGA
jgi:hypothetical protein